MLLADLPTDVQSEPKSLDVALNGVRCATERLEDPLQRVGWHADTGVANAKLDAVVLAEQGDLDITTIGRLLDRVRE